jgi:hypothetical protein
MVQRVEDEALRLWLFEGGFATRRPVIGTAVFVLEFERRPEQERADQLLYRGDVLSTGVTTSGPLPLMLTAAGRDDRREQSNCPFRHALQHGVLSAAI